MGRVFIPPRIERQMPTDPFERWLATQAVLGHDKDWLRRNTVALRQRFDLDPEANLPEPLPVPEKAYDRYAEL